MVQYYQQSLKEVIMVRFKNLPIKENEGKLTYGNEIVDDIVILAVSEIPYVELSTPTDTNKMSNNSVKVTTDKDGVKVEVVVKVHYTQSISDVAFKIQESIRYNVEAMTEYRIANVNVIVNGVSFEEKNEEKNTISVAETQQEG